MADDDAAAPGGRATTRGARAGTTRKTMGAAVAAAKKAAGTTKAAAAPAAKRATTTKAPAARRAPAAPAAKAPAAKRTSPTKATAARTAVARTTPAKTATAKKAPAAKTAARSTTIRATARKAPTSRLAAEDTFDDDLPPPPAPAAPASAANDPTARTRSLLRAAARRLESQGAAPPVATAPGRGPVVAEPIAVAPVEPAAAPDEPGARVLIAPGVPSHEPAEDEAAEDEQAEDEVSADEVAREDEDEDDDEDDEGEWLPPDVIEEPEPEPALVAAAPAGPADDATATLPLLPPPIHAQPTPTPTPAPDAGAAPPPWTPPATTAAEAKPRAEGRPGAGIPVLAILLALIIPAIGALIGFVLATRARRRGAPLATLARVVAVLALVGWLVAGGVLVARNRDSGVDYSKLKVGDCYNSTSSTEVRGVKVIPCSKPHNSEVFFLVTHPAAKGAAYPGKDTLVQFAADACLGQPLTSYVGVPLEQSKLKDFEIVPQASGWKDGRRVLVCGLDSDGLGKVTGSAKGSRR